MQPTRSRVLAAIADGPVSGPAIASDLDVSRAAVWKHVDAIRDAGFEVEVGPDGYELVDVPAFGGPAVEFGLDAPVSIEYHDAIDSTNRRARELATEGAEDVVVLADEQTGGRGRLDRAWASPSGGVWMSLLLRPDVPPTHAPALTLAAALAVTRTAREAGVDAAIKWPNDVVVPASPGSGEDGGYAHRKLAGILTEMEGEADRVAWMVVGVGINADVDPVELPGDANPTSLREQVGDVDRRGFTQRVIEEFDAVRSDLREAVAAAIDLSVTIGERVRIETRNEVVEGQAVDVRFPGALIVETDEGEVAVTTGDCEHLRPVE